MGHPKPRPADSVAAFVSEIEDLSKGRTSDDPRLIFRGQADASWDLVPAVQRDLAKNVSNIRAFIRNNLEEKGKTEGLTDSQTEELIDDLCKEEVCPLREQLVLKEIGMLTAFKKASVPFLGSFDRGSKELEWLALAQHHYLPTRLLDWTYHAATALYFAVDGAVSKIASDPSLEYEDGRSCAVWVTSFQEEFSVEEFKGSIKDKHGKKKQTDPMSYPFSVDFKLDSKGQKKGTVLFYDPAHITTRLAVQRGCFTLHSSRYKTSLVEWPGKFGLQKIEIPYKNVKQVRKTLWQLGNRGSNVFPGLDGIALDIVAAFELDRRHSDYPL